MTKLIQQNSNDFGSRSWSKSHVKFFISEFSINRSRSWSNNTNYTRSGSWAFIRYISGSWSKFCSWSKI